MQFSYKSKNYSIEGVSDSDHISTKMAKAESFYELDLLEYISKVVDRRSSSKSLSCAIDVGANIGNHSVYFGSLVADRVLAVEPNPQIISILDRNLNQNNIRYTLKACALGAKSSFGVVELVEDQNVGMARIRKTGSGKGDECIDIITLDAVVTELVEQEPDIDISFPLVKIDVEGMELEVLKGAAATLEKYRPHVFVEAASRKELDTLIEFLSPFGYRAVSKWAGTPVYHFAYKPARDEYVKAALYKVLFKIKRTLRSLRRKIKRLTIKEG